jgi:hypothetical protein
MVRPVRTIIRPKRPPSRLFARAVALLYGDGLMHRWLAGGFVLVGLASCGDDGATGAAQTGGAATGPAATGPGDATGSGGSEGLTGTGLDPTTAPGSSGAVTSGGETGVTTGEPDTGGPAASYWHIEPPVGDGRTWLVSPGGERVFMLGVNTTMRSKECDGMDGWIDRHPPTKSAQIEWARMGSGQSGAEVVAAPYCFNSVGAFSNINEFGDGLGDSYMIRPEAEGGAGAPYSVVVNVNPGGADRALRAADSTVLESGVSGARFGDPFNPAFIADIEQLASEQIAPRREDTGLQIWYLGNEIGVFDKGAKSSPGVRDFRRYLWSQCPEGSTIDAPLCAPDALAAFLRERYAGDITALNAAWAGDYADFPTIVGAGPRPIPYVSDCNLQCRVDLQIFVHDRLLRAWVELLTTRVRAADPNHIISTPRMAIGKSSLYRFWTPASEADPEVWVEDGVTPVPTDTAEVRYNPFDLLARVGDAGFDVVAFNIYSGANEFEKPWFTDGVHRVQEMSGLPVIISEFGIRAKIAGWSNKGGADSFVPAADATDDQIQRGAYYQSQLEQFYSFRGIIGANWHAWSDRYLAADPAHQINMGLVRCDDAVLGYTAGERWPGVDERVAASNCNIMPLIAAKTGL